MTITTETFTTFNRKPNRHTSSSQLHQKQDEDDENLNEDDPKDQLKDDTEPTWIERAMGTAPEDPVPGLSLEPPLTTTRRGIAGFAVDPDLGFVCVLHHDSENDTDDDSGDLDGPSLGQHRFVYTVISPLDRTTVQSPEALCLVQLAGGLDLGAVIFPPDTLARLIKVQIDDDDDDDGGSRGDKLSVEELRSRVRLLAITVTEDDDSDGDKVERVISSPLPSSNDERDKKIAQASAKVMTAVMNLPGLKDVTLDQVAAAMQLHADSNGNIDRSAFSELLGTLRRNTIENGKDGRAGGHLKFRLTASLAEEENSDSPSTLVDFYASPFESIALALRYKVKVTVSSDCLKSGLELNGMGKVIERFSAFRPVQELEEDAKIMDGFIPSMFFKETGPKNDDKA